MVENIIVPNSITAELAEETGWHIGDGSMNYYNNQGELKGFYQLRGHIEDDREHYENRIKPVFKLLYGIDISLREMPSTRVFGFQIWSNKLTEFKKKLGLPLGKKFEVNIPHIFLTSDELKKAIVRGVFDTDGGIYLEKKNNKLYPVLYIVTISKQLFEQLINILCELEFRATGYSWLSKKGNRKRAYRVTLKGEEMFHKFMEIIKPANPKHTKKHIFYKEQALNSF